MCLDHSIYRRKYATELVEELDPRVKVLFAMIDNFAERDGCHQDLDFNVKLFSLKWSIADIAFKIGVLAGAIFAGCWKEQIDRFERGMVVSLTSDNRLVKSGD